MTPDEFLKHMLEIIGYPNLDVVNMSSDEIYDTIGWGSEFRGQSEKHIAADELMCEVLKSLGYQDGVRAFEHMDKWYD